MEGLLIITLIQLLGLSFIGCGEQAKRAKEMGAEVLDRKLK
jgi:hypothetical protein